MKLHSFSSRREAPVASHRTKAAVLACLGTLALCVPLDLRADVALDPNGWTDITPAADSRTVFVSADGNDAHDGLSPSFTSGSHGPKRTVDAGRSLLRNGMPDRLLLRSGDTFDSGLHVGSLSGRSETEPMIFSSYGPAVQRPLLLAPVTFSGASHIAVLHLGVALTRGEQNGGFYVNGTDVLIEGCRVDGGDASGIALSGLGTNGAGEPSRNIRVRRNIFYENFFNVFIYNTDTLLFEGNVILHPPTPIQGSDMHGMYITREGNTNITVVDNLLLQYPDINIGDGIKIRPGGVVRGNVIVGAAWTGINMGGANDHGGPVVGTDGLGIIEGNLVMDSPNNNEGIGISGRYVQTPIRVADNILLRLGVAASLGGPGEITGNCFVEGYINIGNAPDLTWSRNVFYGSTSETMIQAQSVPDSPNFQARDNRFHYPHVNPFWLFAIPYGGSFEIWKTLTGETGSDAPFSFVDISRSLGTYNASLGGIGTTRAFFEQAAAAHTRATYDPRYGAAAAIAYIRAGLQIAGEPPPNTYAAWRAANFTGTDLTNDAISGPAADPDGCGINNWLRYAHALPARGPVAPPTTLGTAGIGAARRLSLSFNRRVVATDLSYIVESSPDLTTWTPVPGRTYSPGASPVIAEDSVAMDTATRRFLRVRVAQP